MAHKDINMNNMNNGNGHNINHEPLSHSNSVDEDTANDDQLMGYIVELSVCY